jgi:CO dehydrogenase/acetyl-CoA synthase beta subunit
MAESKGISDSSSLRISLPMIIQAVGFIGALVYGYGQLNTRIQFLEVESQRTANYIKEMKEQQDDPIPSDVRQDIILEFILEDIEELKENL